MTNNNTTSDPTAIIGGDDSARLERWIEWEVKKTGKPAGVDLETSAPISDSKLFINDHFPLPNKDLENAIRF